MEIPTLIKINLKMYYKNNNTQNNIITYYQKQYICLEHLFQNNVCSVMIRLQMING